MFNERKTVTPTISGTAGEPHVYILPLALQKMEHIVKGCAKEIGWLGTVQREGNNLFIKDVFLFKQQVHSATCEIKPEGISDFVCDLFTNDPENATDIVNELKLWGHSHVNMMVSPSGQDDTQMKTFQDANPWFLRVIANKSGEMEFTLFDFDKGLQWKNIKWMEYRQQYSGIKEQIDAEIKEKVSDIVYANTVSPIVRGKSYYEDMYEERYSSWWEKNKTTEKKIEGIVDTEEEVVDEETTWVMIGNGYVEIPVRKNGVIKTLVIESNFLERELQEIAQCSTIQQVKVLADMYDSLTNYTEDDYIQIFSYASNKYPA